MKYDMIPSVLFLCILVEVSVARHVPPCLPLTGAVCVGRADKCPDGHIMTSSRACRVASDVCCVSQRLEVDTHWIPECGLSLFADAGEAALPRDTLNPTIVGGVDARKGEFPWQVMLTANGEFQCGGVLIDTQWVLTAAHCVENTQLNYDAVLGEYDRFQQISLTRVQRTIDPANVHIHGAYDPLTNFNDIALLKMTVPIEVNNYIRPACAPEELPYSYAGQECVVSGWGLTEEGGAMASILQYTRVPVQTLADCRQAYSGVGTIHDSNVCAGANGRDACTGDSGGPLACKTVNNTFQVIGIVSWGEGCGNPAYPGVYSQVASFLDWIGNTTGGVFAAMAKAESYPPDGASSVGSHASEPDFLHGHDAADGKESPAKAWHERAKSADD